jgi:Bacterial membrane protein YfhO
VTYPGWRASWPLALLVQIALAAVCFGRLAVEPCALLVDGSRPSIDRANTGEPRPVGNDATFTFIPQHLWISSIIAQFGHVPFWDTRGFGGRPLAGNPQSGMFYPPVWLAWWSGSPAMLGWLTVGHLIWAGFGVYVLSRTLGQGQVAATVAGGVFEASPFLLAHVFEGHYPHVWAVCWYPWAFQAYTELRAGRARGRIVLPVILALIFLAGHPQEWLLLVVALSAWAASDAVRARWGRGRPCPQARANALWWIAALLVALGMAAVELGPEWCVRPWLRRNHEPTRGTDIPTRHHLTAFNGLQFLNPGVLGGPADYFGNDNYWETVLSIGLVPMVLCAVAIARHPDRRLVWGWVALVAVSFWFACGRHLGLFTLVYNVVPGMSFFRVPARSLFLANLATAVLAGLGIDALGQADGRWWRKFGVAVAVVAVVVLGALLVVRSTASAHRGAARARDRVAVRMLSDSAEPEVAIGAVRRPLPVNRAALAADRVLHDPAFWITLVAIGGVLLAGSSCRRPNARTLTAGFVGLVALCELGWLGFDLLKTAPADRFIASSRLAQVGAKTMPPLRVKARDAFYGDLAAVVDGIEKTNINDSFQLDHASLIYETLYPVASHRRPMAERLMSKPVQESWRRVRQAVFDRMSVAYLVSNCVELDPGWPVLQAAGLGEPPCVIQKNPAALPRAYVVPRAFVVADHPGVMLGSFADVDPRQSVLMSHDPLTAIPADCRQAFTPATWMRIDPDRPTLAVTIEAPGFLVVADTWMPGWTAMVDGRPVRVERGNYAQRVIPLDTPGRHTITMRYRPPGLIAGSAISLATGLVWLCCVALTVWKHSQRSRRPEHSTQAAYQGPHALKSAVGARVRS